MHLGGRVYTAAAAAAAILPKRDEGTRERDSPRFRKNPALTRSLSAKGRLENFRAAAVRGYARARCGEKLLRARD